MSSQLQAVKTVYHQIRASTSPAFNVNSNTQTFGGNTGSTQTYWTLTGLGSGKWYFQIRSSYDGINFNQWKNINPGSTNSENLVTVEAATNCAWAVFDLPGEQTFAVGEGFGADGAGFGLPTGVYSSAMATIVGPNGFSTVPPQVSNIIESDVTVQTPTGLTSSSSNIADYPPQINMKYGNRSYPQSAYSGNANLFAIAFDSAGQNVTVYDSTDGVSSWAVFKLPGGALLAIGAGQAADGDSIYVPTETPWITASNLLSIVSVAGGGGNATGRGAGGINAAQLSGLTMQASYRNYDSSDTWSGVGNWLAVSWTPGLTTSAVTAGEFLILNLADGNQIAFGAGANLTSGGSFGLPTGFTTDQMAAIVTPASFTNNGDNCLHAVAACNIPQGSTVNLEYIDGSGNNWSGGVNWFAFCWRDAVTTSPAGSGIAVTINPSQLNLLDNATFTFIATVTGTGTTTVTWSVDGVVGGNSTTGTITSAGLYTAPNTPGTHQITAVSTVDATRVGFAVAKVSAIPGSGVIVQSTPPSGTSYLGAQVYDTTNNFLYTYTASGWVVSNSAVTVQTTAPTGSSYIGAQVFDSTTSTLYIYTSTGWVVA